MPIMVRAMLSSWPWVIRAEKCGKVLRIAILCLF